MSHTYLKIKIKSLAAEARIIRLEEGRFPGHHPTREGLHNHRVNDVRKETRAALLAYAYLRGRSFKQVEPKPSTNPGFSRVIALAKKYASHSQNLITGDRIMDWFAGGEPHPKLVLVKEAA